MAGTAVKRKFFCECVLENGSTVYITVKAVDEAQATEIVHEHYGGVEYVLDTFTELQMEYKKRHLRRSIVGTVSNI